MSTSISVPSNPSSQAESLRQQMRAIRRELGTDVEELVEHAERLLDWRYYMHRYPWGMLGAAAFLGYFLVPGRTVVFPTDQNMLSQLAERIPVVVKPSEPKKQGFLAGLIAAGLGMAGKAALGFAAQRLTNMLSQRAFSENVQPEEVYRG